jgi:hypothetical protein
MFIALDKLTNQGLKQAIIVVPEKSIGASFNDEPLTKFGFWADWQVEPRWNLCNAPGSDNSGKVKSVEAFLKTDHKVLVCTHATFRFAVDQYGVEAFDNRLIAVDEFHHVSANPDNKLGLHLGQFIARDRVHIVAMTGSYFRGDAEAVLAPQDESTAAAACQKAAEKRSRTRVPRQEGVRHEADVRDTRHDRRAGDNRGGSG